MHTRTLSSSAVLRWPRPFLFFLTTRFGPLWLVCVEGGRGTYPQNKPPTITKHKKLQRFQDTHFLLCVHLDVELNITNLDKQHNEMMLVLVSNQPSEHKTTATHVTYIVILVILIHIPVRHRDFRHSERQTERQAQRTAGRMVVGCPVGKRHKLLQKTEADQTTYRTRACYEDRCVFVRGFCLCGVCLSAS